MSDTVAVKGEFDAEKAFEMIAEIIGDREGMEIRLKSIRKKTEKNEPAAGQ